MAGPHFRSGNAEKNRITFPIYCFLGTPAARKPFFEEASSVRNLIIVATLVLCSTVLSLVGAAAQTTGDATGAKATTHERKVPESDRLVALITSTLIALNQANATGNYSVFRELGAPGFQVVNSTGQLSETFAELRAKNFDLSPIVLLQPKLLRRPEINSNGMLRVTGFFPTQPERLNFDLIFQAVYGQWRLFGIAANTTPLKASESDKDIPKEAKAKAVAASSAPVPATTERLTSRGESNLAKPAPADVRDRVQQLEMATGEPTSQSKPGNEDSYYNPLKWLR